MKLKKISKKKKRKGKKNKGGTKENAQGGDIEIIEVDIGKEEVVEKGKNRK